MATLEDRARERMAALMKAMGREKTAQRILDNALDGEVFSVTETSSLMLAFRAEGVKEQKERDAKIADEIEVPDDGRDNWVGAQVAIEIAQAIRAQGDEVTEN